MKNNITKVLAAVIAMAGISQTQAAEKSVVDRIKEAAKEINKEINKDHSKKPKNGFSGGAVRG